MPRRGSSLGRANYVVGSGVANTVGGSHVLFRRRDPFSLVELAILALDVVALFLVSTVPFAGDLAGEVPRKWYGRYKEERDNIERENRELDKAEGIATTEEYVRPTYGIRNTGPHD